MKVRCALLFLFALALAWPVCAAPPLLVDTTLTVRHTDGSENVWHPLPLTLASGNKGLMESADRRLEVTPTLKGEMVVVGMILSRIGGRNELVEARPQSAMRLGQVGTIEVGEFKLSLTVTLAP